MSIKVTTESFIEKAKSLHNDKYDYSKVEYVNAKTKVCIICPIHGEFIMSPNNHLNNKGCPKCGDISVWDKRGRITTDKFIENSKKIHGDKYDYSKTEYVNNKSKVCIICNEHGEFDIRPDNHINLKQGCPKCVGNIKSSTTEFIEKAKKVHGDKYDYSKVDYINAKSKICIICNKHGEFYQKANNHLNGQGCPKCNISQLENETTKILNNINVEYEYQKRFEWLSLQSLDFYIPKLNIAIECQGEQHFKSVQHFGGEKGFKHRQYLDDKKKSLCEQHNIQIFYYPNIYDKSKLITNILKLWQN